MVVFVFAIPLFLCGQSVIINEDNIGSSNFISEIDIYEEAMEPLIDSLPGEYQDSIKLIFSTLYLYQYDYLGGYENYIDELKQLALSESAYSIHVVTFFSHNFNIIDYRVYITLPEDTFFVCLKKSDISFIEAELRDCLKASNENLIANCIVNGIQNLGKIIEDSKLCCANRSSCEDDCLIDDDRLDYILRSSDFYYSEIEIDYEPYVSSSHVDVFANISISNYPTLVTDIENWISGEFGNESTKKIAILDRYDACASDIPNEYFLNKDYLAVFVLVEFENESYIYEYWNLPCWLSYSINNYQPWAAIVSMNPEQFDAFIFWYALYKDSGDNSFWATRKAIYNVCLSEPVHLALSGAGFVCDPCDLVDAGIYAIEGEWTQAAWSSIALVPVVGSPIANSIKCSFKVVGVSGRKIELLFVKHGVRYFGYRGQLARVIGKVSGKSAHHIIPWNLFDKKFDKLLPIRRLVSNGFHPNQAENGMNVVSTIKNKLWNGKIEDNTFHGNHPKYDDFVTAELQLLSDNIIDDVEFVEAVNDLLIPKMKQLIGEAETAVRDGKIYKGEPITSLNDYFKMLLD